MDRDGSEGRPEPRETAESEARIMAEHGRRMVEIGLALSSESDVERIFEMVVDEARRLTHAEAGTLYIVNERDALEFAVVQNEPLGLFMGGSGRNRIDLPPVRLHDAEGRPNHANVSSHVALTGRSVNIPDVYTAEGFDFSGTRTYDGTTGFRSRSMLVIPMRNHEARIIGVLQLLNARDASGAPRPFDEDGTGVVASLASQAAVALTNAQLVRDLRQLLESFIQSIAAAIDAKSPYTRGHIDRVVKLTMLLAGAVNDQRSGAFAKVRLDDAELEELRIAAWMHDLGKIVTPEHIVDKSTKLQAVFDRIELVRTRLALVGERMRVRTLERELELLQAGAGPETLSAMRTMDAELGERLRALCADAAFLEECNRAGEFLSDERLARLRALAERVDRGDGEELPWLTPDELKHLSVRRGTLTDEERRIVERHAVVTRQILSRLPFPRRLSRVPRFAGAHHEKLNGRGYPEGLSGDALSLQERILAIADVFEALTARDRPYKEPLSLSRALGILGRMRDAGELDPDLYDLFVRERVFATYAATELDAAQLDC